jgi:ankyrin repeat protein
VQKQLFIHLNRQAHEIFFLPFLQEFSETSLHHAISKETGTSLHMVDFIIQNSSSLDRRTREGNTPLHYCVIQNQPEAMRLLLRSGASPDLANNNGKTPLSIAKERGYHLCEELVRAKNTTNFFALFCQKNIYKHL